MNSTGKKVYRLGVFLLIFGVGVLGYPFVLILFHKSIWFSYFCLIALLIQFLSSKNSGVKPYQRCTLAFLIDVFFLTLLSNYYPILNFHPSSRLSVLFFFIISVCFYGGGHSYLSKRLNNISLVGDRSSCLS